jgi:hypothetical protein
MGSIACLPISITLLAMVANYYPYLDFRLEQGWLAHARGRLTFTQAGKQNGRIEKFHLPFPNNKSQKIRENYMAHDTAPSMQ